MKIVKTIQEVKDAVKAWRAEGQEIALVPTMGFLHNGHKSLMDRARKENGKVVVSIFVNPIQFGPNEDFATYPRDIEHDKAVCESAGVDLIFAPEKEEMYSPQFCSYVGMSILTEELCGKSRPCHFQGVCTVVSKLFHIVTPDRAYFGKKDAQQLAIIKRMVMDLNMDVKVIGCPIIREEDGLAMSSRNTYLSKEERKAALILNRTLNLAEDFVKQGGQDAKTLLQKMKENIEKEPLARIDYVEAVDVLTMKPVEQITESTLVAMAVYIGATRLIDNRMILGGEQ